MASIKQLQQTIKLFCDERNWDEHHDAKDLVIGICTEAGELLHHFRFKSKQDIEEMLSNLIKKEHVNDELADVLYFLLRFSQKYNINLEEAFDKKMKKNAVKYPAPKTP